MSVKLESNPDLDKSFRIFTANSDSPIFTDDYPSHIMSWFNNPQPYYTNVKTELPADGRSWFGFVLSPTQVQCSLFTSPVMLEQGMYFSIKGPATFTGGSGFVVARNGHSALDSIGGPIESAGRLAYIDGCTDSLLISPVKLGDPCLNFLHFPPNIKQTMHTHPSNRIGVVYRGRGRCVTPHGEIPLVPGARFIIPKDGKHCFFTDESFMDVIAWHPDSDFGPQDENHPMLNRTMVDGISASQLPNIQTKFMDAGKDI